MAVASRKPRFRRVKTRNFRLTPRDIEIIRHVNTYRLLDSNYIVGLLGDGSAQQIRRRLQLLFHNPYEAPGCQG